MRRGMCLACVLLGWLVVALLRSDALGAEAPDAFFTCEDLIGLTYRVWIPAQGFVCFEFVSADMVIETYETKGSFTVRYFPKGGKPGVCRIVTQIPFPPAGLDALITSEVFVGIGYIIVIGSPVPVIGQSVEFGECQPGR